jgi:hypothetical protein
LQLGKADEAVHPEFSVRRWFRYLLMSTNSAVAQTLSHMIVSILLSSSRSCIFRIRIHVYSTYTSFTYNEDVNFVIREEGFILKITFRSQPRIDFNPLGFSNTKDADATAAIAKAAHAPPNPLEPSRGGNLGMSAAFMPFAFFSC